MTKEAKRLSKYPNILWQQVVGSIKMSTPIPASYRSYLFSAASNPMHSFNKKKASSRPFTKKRWRSYSFDLSETGEISSSSASSSDGSEDYIDLEEESTGRIIKVIRVEVNSEEPDGFKYNPRGNRFAAFLDFPPMKEEVEITVSENVEEERSQCFLCCKLLEKEQIVAVLKCEHMFCVPCIRSWVKRKPTCPLCHCGI